MENLIIIHGAIGASDQMVPLGNLLKDHFIINNLEFSGHGKRSTLEMDFSMELFMNDLKNILDELGQAHIFGYSMGGFVALLSSASGETRISSITTLGTKLKWNDEIALKECRMLDPHKIEDKVPAFAKILADRHGPKRWNQVMDKTRNLLTILGQSQPVNEKSMKDVHCPVFLILGDHDEMVTLEETNEVEEWIPNSQFSILENSGHPIEKVALPELANKIKKFVKALV